MRIAIVFVVAAFCSAGCSTTQTVTSPSSIERPIENGASAPSPRPPTSVPPVVAPGAEACDASRAADAVGSPATAEVLERARVAAGASVARFLRPNEIVTMEYLGSRLNLGLDKGNVVTSVRCG
jgi:hypothetical protein